VRPALATSPERNEAAELAAASPTLQAFRRFRRHKPALIGALVLTVIALSVLIGPLLLPYKPNAVDLSVFQKPPSFAHPLGTDSAGRDVLTRLLVGGRVSLTIGCLVALLSTSLGLLLGAVAGFYRGLPDFLTMRLTEVVLSFPGLVAVAGAGALFGPSTWLLVVVLSLFSWPTPCLIVRAMTLSIRNLDYVAAARAAGASSPRIVMFEVIPAVLSPLAVFATVAVAQAVLAEAGLSFLGFGVPPPDPSWGNMLNAAESISVLSSQAWLWLPPGLMIAIAVLCINLVGDGLRDAVDPRSAEGLAGFR
jgi:peptide/nickel transport system permease protein